MHKIGAYIFHWERHHSFIQKGQVGVSRSVDHIRIPIAAYVYKDMNEPRYDIYKYILRKQTA